jgi:hypothetical protein
VMPESLHAAASKTSPITAQRPITFIVSFTVLVLAGATLVISATSC